MADSWAPQQSRLRRLQAQQNSVKLASVGGRIRQAAPVLERLELEFPPFNMHVGLTPPDDLYLGRFWYDEGAVVGTPSTVFGAELQNLTLQYANSPDPYNTGVGGSPLIASSLVGSDPWDPSTTSYSFTASSWNGIGRWGRVEAELPSQVMDMITGSNLVNLTVHVTLKYSDDDAGASIGTPIIIGFAGTTFPILLVRGPASADAFRPDNRDTIESYSSSTWVTGGLALASNGQKKQAIQESGGKLFVTTPISTWTNPFSTYVWIYSLTFDVEVEESTGTALGRLKVWTGSQWVNATYRAGDG